MLLVRECGEKNRISEASKMYLMGCIMFRESKKPPPNGRDGCRSDRFLFRLHLIDLIPQFDQGLICADDGVANRDYRCAPALKPILGVDFSPYENDQPD